MTPTLPPKGAYSLVDRKTNKQADTLQYHGSCKKLWSFDMCSSILISSHSIPPSCHCQILFLWSFILVHQRFGHLIHVILFHPNPFLYVATHPKPSPIKFEHSHLQWASLRFFISLSPTYSLYLGPDEQKRIYILPSQPLHGNWLCCHFMSNT